MLSLCAAAGRAIGQQGVASRDLKAQSAPPPSGRPFNARFTDIAQEAGLRAPVIYGGIESKKYILEANGCGCAFIDYDNDGWMDISYCPGPASRETLPRLPIGSIRTTATVRSRT
jgi:hypothetical protein